MKKISTNTKRQKQIYNMFIIKQRGIAKTYSSPCNHYELLYAYYAKVLRWEKILKN
jgi:hypothetical protein